jgi:hypothetical protein
MASRKNYNPNVDEDFVIYFTSILFTCLMDDSTSGMKSQSIIYSQSEVHSIWDFWTSSLQECKGNVFSKVRWGRSAAFGQVQKISNVFLEGCPSL